MRQSSIVSYDLTLRNIQRMEKEKKIYFSRFITEVVGFWDDQFYHEHNTTMMIYGKNSISILKEDHNVERYINFVLRYQKIIELNSPISFMIDKLSASINEVEKIASNQLLNTDQKRSQSPALLSSLPSSLSSSSSSLSSLAKKADSAITTVITDKVKHVKDKFMIEFEAQIDDEDSTIEYDEDETKFEIIKSKKIFQEMSTFAQNFAYETSFERHQKIDFVLGRIVSKYSEYINIMMPMIIQVADALRIENKQEVIANWAKIKIINGLEHDNATFRSRKGSLIESEFSMTMKFVRSSLAAEESKSIRDFYGTFILISEMYKREW
ncbi:hypothetical protein SSS_04046 [Sarcoptes scabiei]|uniref:Uncharacterized protein n=1 Tax=Sarcoptes scabiei TaxID=52283 RepID=A0A834RF43_SARSC|nr:hypothetical protein SSS_04046 [Sarcoptes scabiei]